MRNSGTMHDDGTRPLSVKEAAQLIYATDAPSPSQIRRVEEKLQRRDLRGKKSAHTGGWTTTTGDVAQYLADRALQRQDAKQRGDAQLRGVYDEVFKEYFLALIFRRRTRHASRWFSYAVLLGQIGFLLLLATVSVMSIRSLSPEKPPEHALIEQWIGQRSGEFTVTRWHDARSAPDGEGTAVRVEYRYSTRGGKSIDTDRLFVIDDGRVVRVDSEW